MLEQALSCRCMHTAMLNAMACTARGTGAWGERGKRHPLFPQVVGSAMPFQTGLSTLRHLRVLDRAVMVRYWMQALPKPEEMERLAEHWQPYRSLGSWYMWRLCEVRTLMLLCFLP